MMLSYNEQLRQKNNYIKNLESQLDECREALAEYGWDDPVEMLEAIEAPQKLRRCREELAAAEARVKSLNWPVWDALGQAVVARCMEHHIADALASRFEGFEVGEQEQPNHAALDAYVEERTAELREERDRWKEEERKQFRAFEDAAQELQLAKIEAAAAEARERVEIQEA